MLFFKDALESLSVVLEYAIDFIIWNVRKQCTGFCQFHSADLLDV